jgi:hypothetical protein
MFLITGGGPDWGGSQGDHLDLGGHRVQQHQREGSCQVFILYD